MPTLNMKEVAARLDPSGVAISIADATMDDMPLCYANDAFERMTGYSGDQVLGRNCRFLQGSLENDVARAKMRDALTRGAAAQVVFQNMRADGTVFSNLVVIEPLTDRDKNLVYVVGSQFEIDRDTPIAKVRERGNHLVREMDKLLDLNERLRATSRQALARSMAATVKLWLET